MSVFVGVEMCDADASVPELLDLGGGLAFDVFFFDVAAEEGLNEVDEG